MVSDISGNLHNLPKKDKSEQRFVNSGLAVKFDHFSIDFPAQDHFSIDFLA